MGIYGMMRTSVSGMNAQSNRLSAISDNISNSSTIGYKRSEAHFSSLVMGENVNSYESGSIQTHIRRNISVEGGRRATNNSGDLSILGNGFFIVTDKLDGSGAKFLTRAGDFQPDKGGFLRNSAGFYLLNELGEPVNVGSANSSVLSKAEASKLVNFKGSLPADDKIIGKTKKGGGTDGQIEIDPNDPKTYNHKTSVTTFGPKGEKVVVDVFLQKCADGQWRALAATKDQDGKYIVSDSPSILLKFNKDGTLNTESSGGGKFVLNIKSGANEKRAITIDFTKLDESGSSYSVSPEADGHGPGSYQSFSVSEDGEILVKLTNGQTLSRGFINLATVPAVDLLTVKTGTVFQQNPESGNMIMGRPNSGSFGRIQSQQLEESNADIASELTDMIEAQRNFTANSKVFQTGSEVMEVVVNLKR